MKKVSDSTLNKLGRKVALALWRTRCPLSGNQNINELQAHHIVHRNRTLLKWDWRNLFVVSMSSDDKYKIDGLTAHQFADTLKGRDKVHMIIGNDQWTYLQRMELWNFKDYLVAHGSTRDEFKLCIYNELNAKLKELEE